MRRHLPAFLLTWLGLFWLWFLLAGEWTHQELVAAAIASAVAGAVAEAARTLTRAGGVPSRAVLAAAPPALWQIVVDYWVITRVLILSIARRRVVRGEWVKRPCRRGDTAWAEYLAAFSPNAYPVEVDTQSHSAVFHDLVPRRDSEAPL